MYHTVRKSALTAVLISLSLVSLACAKGPVYIDPANTDDDFAVQGEYAGQISTGDGELEIASQVIALGKGKFKMARYVGGFPSAGWDGEVRLPIEATKSDDGTVKFAAEQAYGLYRNGVIEVHLGERQVGTLKKIERKSPTLGKKPPQGAVVLFDGSSAKAWKGGKIENGLLMPGTTSQQQFQSHRIHIEFRLPYQPEDRGQQRGNSGIYSQSRYEVQMLDSFGLEGKDNECGGIYSIKDPDVNMCFPPLTWQTYDVDFLAGQFNAKGEMTKKPRITVRHNGVLIHRDVELPKSTTAAPMKPGPEPGPIYLQGHGSPVRYRNIWVEPML